MSPGVPGGSGISSFFSIFLCFYPIFDKKEIAKTVRADPATSTALKSSKIYFSSRRVYFVFLKRSKMFFSSSPVIFSVWKDQKCFFRFEKYKIVFLIWKTQNCFFGRNAMKNVTVRTQTRGPTIYIRTRTAYNGYLHYHTGWNYAAWLEMGWWIRWVISAKVEWGTPPKSKCSRRAMDRSPLLAHIFGKTCRTQLCLMSVLTERTTKGVCILTPNDGWTSVVLCMLLWWRKVWVVANDNFWKENRPLGDI